MEFFQELIFTAFLSLVLYFLVAKIVTFAISNTSPDVDSVASEGIAEKGVILERGLEVSRGKGEKRVKFVDEAVIKRVDRYEGSENLVLLDDVEEVIAEDERVGQFGGDVDSGVRESMEECFDERELDEDDANVEGSEKIEMLLETEGFGGDSYGENVVKCVSDEREGNGGNEGKKVRDESDDDWDGVERSELEKSFAEAVNYVECGGKGREDDRLARLGSDVRMQLYGLHKVALEGPCLEPQPMALKVSARTKWNAWQRVGSTSQEMAMEQYIQVLSENIPQWMHDHGCSTDEGIQRNNEISVAEHIRLGSETSTTHAGGQSSTDKGEGLEN